MCSAIRRRSTWVNSFCRLLGVAWSPQCPNTATLQLKTNSLIATLWSFERTDCCCLFNRTISTSSLFTPFDALLNTSSWFEPFGSSVVRHCEDPFQNGPMFDQSLFVFICSDSSESSKCNMLLLHDEDCLNPWRFPIKVLVLWLFLYSSNFYSDY